MGLHKRTRGTPAITRMRARNNANAQAAEIPALSMRLLVYLHKLRDPAFWADGPAVSSRGECDAVVLLSVQRTPRCTVVHRNVGPRRANGDPPVLRPNDAGAERQRFLNERPCFAAVAGGCPGRRSTVGLAVIAADDHPVSAIPEGD